LLRRQAGEKALMKHGADAAGLRQVEVNRIKEDPADRARRRTGCRISASSLLKIAAI
jgi:hypothetical protein